MQAGCKVTVELSSVNRRQAELTLNLPRELESLESRLRERISQNVSRGRVTGRVTVMAVTGKAWVGAGFNLVAAREATKELRRLIKDLRLAGDVTLDALLRIPGVFGSNQVGDAAAACWPALESAMDKAVKAMVRMREKEGGHLARELERRMGRIRAGARRIRQWAPGVLDRYREQLRERVRQAGIDVPAVDDERLAKELVYFADRSDITEELARLESHFAQFEETLLLPDPAGRTLDFLAQEMHREVNTIGSKGNDGRISREVVILKTEIEKFREQVQNVE